jgi:hypothetical protein
MPFAPGAWKGGAAAARRGERLEQRPIALNRFAVRPIGHKLL